MKETEGERFWRELANQYRTQRDQALARIAAAQIVGQKIGSGKAHVLEALKEPTK